MVDNAFQGHSLLVKDASASFLLSAPFSLHPILPPPQHGEPKDSPSYSVGVLAGSEA